ncbi:MAG: DUF4982 domain-containing protein [Sphingobium sp.]|nr:DUF4982 domain-containing protein [Sphingobium sp.]
MRSLIVAVTVLTTSLLLAQIAPAASTTPAAETSRQVTQLATGWRFFFRDTAGAQAPGFDDAGWQTVSVPHSWNRVGTYLTTNIPHTNRPDTVNKSQGIAWYRLPFATPAGSRGRQVWLEFDAASRAAEVWLNGRKLGEHRGGFSRFRLNATAALAPDGKNLLAVKVDNSNPAPGSSTADIFPLAGDFFVHGGLYRPVRLVMTNPIHIAMTDAGGSGVYARTESIGQGRARVGATIKLSNDGARAAQLVVAASLIDGSGRQAATVSKPLVLAAGATADAAVQLDVARAHLWQGVEDPHLYKLVATVSEGGRVLDRVTQDFGIRQMAFDPDKGFQLNGKPYALRGVGYHQDHEGKGWAIDETDVARDIAILRDMGVTSIRLTHYQHGEPIHRLADRAGIILWDEVAVVSTWTLGNEETMPPARLANVRQQLRELIRQNYNHASVANWGLANEVDFGNSLPGFVTPPNGQLADPLILLKDLRQIATMEDPSRPTSIATCCEGRLFAPGTEVPIVSGAVDLGGANRYFGWYYGVPEDLRDHLTQLRAARPGQPLAITEYGAGGALSMHTDNPLGGPVDSRGRNQPEEYMSYVHEQNWGILSERHDLWATWLWSGFDFATTIRREGDADDINTKGLVTYDRAVKKDPYFFYRANWSSNPTVYITGRRYTDRAYGITDVRVYSNAPTTELVLNGRSLGTRNACPQKICVWPAVRLQTGANRIVARGTFGKSRVEDVVQWTLANEVAANIRIDSGALMAAPSESGRFGSDNFFEGGTAGTVNAPANYGRPAEVKQIAGSRDAALLATYREGTFSYRVPARPGSYTLRLSFVEPSESVGARVFDVLVNGERRLAGIDIASAGGAPLTLVQRTIPVQVGADGLLIDFRPTRGKAIVSAVELLSAN